MSDKTNTQLTTATGYDAKSRMIFSDPVSGTIPDSKPAINYQRVTISTRNEDGTVGELILPTEKLFSFGVQENLNPDTGKPNGYVMPLCLWNRDGPTKAEKAWTDAFDAIVETCKDYIIENREELGLYETERNDLKKFNPLYWKRDKGKIVEGTGPSLYAKLIVSKKQNKVVTMFYNEAGEALNALDLINKYCHATSAIKIESIFFGNKISLQVKLYESEVIPSATGMKRLLDRPSADGRVRVLTKKTAAVSLLDDEEEEEDDEGSLNESEEEEKPKKKVVKKRVKKVVRRKTAEEE